MKRPEISIILPAYNCEKYVDACIASILYESFSDFEIIAVDDGSIDSTLSILNEWAQKDGRVKVFHKGNGGVSSARNYGLSKASGEYICFVDSDDELPEGALEKLMARTAPGIDFVMGGYEMFDESGVLTYSIEERVESTLSREDAVKQMYKPDYYIYWGFICSKLYKRSIIEKNNLRFDEDIKFNEDRLFTIRYLASQLGNALMFTEPVYKYILRGTSVMSSITNAKFNPLVETEFTASVRMKNIIKKTFRSPELTDFAYKGILTSYSTIHDRMMKSGSIDRSVHRRLFLSLLVNVPFKHLLSIKL